MPLNYPTHIKCVNDVKYCHLILCIGVYTDVSKYNDWIDEIISTDNLPKYIIPKSELVNEKPKSDASLMTFSVFIPLCAVSVAVSREYHR